MSFSLFRVATDSYYIFTKYYYDPISVLASSKINLLPYQLEDFLNLLDLADSGIPVRVLIAYETGLGKTILAGLFIKEMILRNPNTRVLILTPPNVQYQWQEELKNKFSLEFPILREVDREGKDPLSENWLIASMDTLKGEKWLRKVSDYKWDIVVVDELHRATIKNRRAQLIQAVRDRTRHMFALTATPHDGKEEQFIFRLNLINQNVDEQNWEEFLKKYTFRRRKKEVLDLEGRKIFPQKTFTSTVEIEPDEDEKEFYREVEEYIRNYYRLADQENDRSIGLVATIVGRAVSSSIRAGVKVLENRYRRLFEGFAQQLENAEEILSELLEAEEEGDDKKLEEIRMKIIQSVPANKELVEKEKEILEKLIERGRKLIEKGEDRKTEMLIKLVDEHLKRGDKIVLFTQFLATLFHLEEVLGRIYGKDKISIVHGGMTPEEKKFEIARFWNDAKIIIGTDALGESLNLQAGNVVINYEIPWNPVVYIQRVGRVYRYGQKKEIYVLSMLPVFKIERRVLEVVIRKVETIEKEFDIGSVEIIGMIISEKDVENEIWRAYVEDRIEAAGEDLVRKFDAGMNLIQKIRLVLEKAEAAKRHVRAEKILEGKNIAEIITEDDLRKYLYHFKEAGFGDGKFLDEFTFFEIKNGAIEPVKILLENKAKPTKAKILDLKETNFISEKELKLDNPAILKALYIGMCQRGFAIFAGDEEGYGEVRILKLFDFYEEPFYEVPVVVFNGYAKPFSFLRALEPILVSPEVEKEILKQISYKVSRFNEAFIDSSYIEELKEEQRLFLKERMNRLIDGLNIEIEYHRRHLSEEFAKKKIEELEERKREEFKRILRINEKISEPVATFYVIRAEKLREILEEVAEKINKKEVFEEVARTVEHFDPELWRKKREVELAGMRLVMKYEKQNGREPIDVSAEGRGYDIESYDPKSKEKRRIEVKSFKELPEKITFSENEYKAAKFYGDSYYLYIVKRAFESEEKENYSDIEVIQNPASKLKFEIEWRPYYTCDYRKISGEV
ncbi:MAG: helicase-related protein [Archaeoglobaceae archaeon]